MSAATASVSEVQHGRSPFAADARFALLTALGLALFPLLLHPIGGYGGLATQILIVSIASIGFNLILGYAGMLSYGHAMFYGGGGYIELVLGVLQFHPFEHVFGIEVVVPGRFPKITASYMGRVNE
jgi:ABC-type branched-subunit amino acid transport system permease subunit